MKTQKVILFLSVIVLGIYTKTYAQSDSIRIMQHLKTITKTVGYRNYKNIPLLNQTAEYIFSVFRQYADTVYATIDTHNFKAPAKIEGIDFSDHLNYWKFNYDALMVTNTCNRNYHQTSDTMETLDVSKMMKVIDTTASAIKKL